MVKRGLKSSAWILFYMTTYVVFQLIFSIVVAVVREVWNGTGDIEGAVNSGIGQTIILASVASIGLYLISMKFRNLEFKDECKFEAISAKHGLMSGALGLSGLAVSSIILAIFAMLQGEAYLEHISNMELILSGNKALVFLSVGIVAPIIEEIIFRGLVFSELERRIDLKYVIIVQALLFGLYHFSLAQGAYTVFLGIILGISLVWTGSIWAPIIIHVVNNSLSFGLSLIGVENESLMAFVGIMILIGIALFPVLLTYLYKSRVNGD